MKNLFEKCTCNLTKNIINKNGCGGKNIANIYKFPTREKLRCRDSSFRERE